MINEVKAMLVSSAFVVIDSSVYDEDSATTNPKECVIGVKAMSSWGNLSLGKDVGVRL